MRGNALPWKDRLEAGIARSFTTRGEQEIIDCVPDYARRDDGVRAVIRMDLLPVRDCLFAYHFILVVSDVDLFDRDVFEQCLGERILLFRADRKRYGLALLSQHRRETIHEGPLPALTRHLPQRGRQRTAA